MDTFEIVQAVVGLISGIVQIIALGCLIAFMISFLKMLNEI
jgi:hypothetical protein